jgi:hypothetical protein
MEPDLASRRLRASRAFVLLGFDELDADRHDRYTALRADPDLFGILEPVDSRLPAKSVSKEAALLLLSLRSARRVPALLASIFGDDPGPLYGLLADGVLEVEHEGTFVSGRDALRLLEKRDPVGPPTTFTSKLSSAAIESAATYAGLDAAALARKVYAYGRLPCTPSIRRRFATDVDLLSFLAPDPEVADLLASGWMAKADGESPWLSFDRLRAPTRLGYKLYVSAQLDALPRVFAMAVRALARTRCDHFKIGRGGEGLCRPDKMVAYFTSLDPLRECASLIEGDLLASDVAPSSVHGVPFTAGIDGSGFLAWGMDPPKLGHFADEATSWREWIASRVAVALLSAKGAAGGVDATAFVLERLQLDGIDTGTWAPTLAMWRAHAARPEDVA